MKSEKGKFEKGKFEKGIEAGILGSLITLSVSAATLFGAVENKKGREFIVKPSKEFIDLAVNTLPISNIIFTTTLFTKIGLLIQSKLDRKEKESKLKKLLTERIELTSTLLRAYPDLNFDKWVEQNYDSIFLFFNTYFAIKNYDNNLSELFSQSFLTQIIKPDIDFNDTKLKYIAFINEFSVSKNAQIKSKLKELCELADINLAD